MWCLSPVANSVSSWTLGNVDGGDGALMSACWWPVLIAWHCAAAGGLSVPALAGVSGWRWSMDGGGCRLCLGKNLGSLPESEKRGCHDPEFSLVIKKS